MNKGRKKNKGRKLAGAMIGAALGLLFYSGSFYVRAYMENKAEKENYESLQAAYLVEDTMEEIMNAGLDEIEELTGETTKGATEDELAEQIATATEKERSSERETIQEERRESFGIKWGELREINDQIIAWIIIPNADISYPVVQGEDNEYYLHHSFNKEEDAFGAIFLEADNSSDFEDSHSFVYGHNMEGNMMFANLNRYEKKEFLQQCPEFYIYTPEKMFCYEIFSVEQAGETSPGLQYGFEAGSEEYEIQMGMIAANSMYETGVTLEPDKKMVTLVTCNSKLDEHVRMAVHGFCKEEQSWQEDE